MEEQTQSPGERLRERRLIADLRESGRLGTPLGLTSTPFKVDPEAIADAIVTGPRRYMVRRRRIEDGIDALLAEARATWLALARRHADPTRFVWAWRTWVRRLDTSTLNRLIDAHNRYFPIEANLPMDLRTGDYATFDGQDFRYARIDTAWLLAHFPEDHAAALAAATE
jgi:hypothetical protein